MPAHPLQIAGAAQAIAIIVPCPPAFAIKVDIGDAADIGIVPTVGAAIATIHQSPMPLGTLRSDPQILLAVFGEASRRIAVAPISARPGGSPVVTVGVAVIPFAAFCSSLGAAFDIPIAPAAVFATLPAIGISSSAIVTIDVPVGRFATFCTLMAALRSIVGAVRTTRIATFLPIAAFGAALFAAAAAGISVAAIAAFGPRKPVAAAV